MMTLSCGQVINDRYRIERFVNGGGFGHVFEAYDQQQQRKVAIKIITEDTTSDNRERNERRNALLNEILVLAKLHHANLPEFYGPFYFEDQLCMSMQYIPGEDLSQFFVEGRPQNAHIVVYWICQVLDALAFLHHQSPPIIHRDIKLENIRIHSETGQIYVLDFGIASTSSSSLHGSYGSKPYASPEQYRSDIPMPTDDIYAVGVVLYMLLTGKEPVDSMHRLSKKLISPSEFNQKIPRKLEQIVLRSMAIEPAYRYQDAQSMLMDLKFLNTICHDEEINKLKEERVNLIKQIEIIEEFKLAPFFALWQKKWFLYFNLSTMIILLFLGVISIFNRLLPIDQIIQVVVSIWGSFVMVLIILSSIFNEKQTNKLSILILSIVYSFVSFLVAIGFAETINPIGDHLSISRVFFVISFFLGLIGLIKIYIRDNS